MSYPTVAKVVFIGDSGVGRSVLLERHATDYYNPTKMATIGIDYISDNSDPKMKLQLWDTAGQERFREITKAYYRGAHAIVVTFDCAHQVSFNNVGHWVDHVYSINRSPQLAELRTILLITKAEFTEKRVVPFQAALAKAKQLNFDFVCETSSKENVNVKEVSHALRFILGSENFSDDYIYAYQYETPGKIRAYRREDLTEVTELLSQQGKLDLTLQSPIETPVKKSNSQKANCYKPLAKSTERESSCFLGSPDLSQLQKITSFRRSRINMLNYAVLTKKIDQDSLCELCFKNPINTKFKSCNHSFACSACLANGRVAQCMVCVASNYDQL